LTSGFYNRDTDTGAVAAFQGNLTIQNGNIVSTTDYHMEGGNTLTFYANANTAGKVSVLTLDVGGTGTQSGTKQAVFLQGGTTGTENSTVSIFLGETGVSTAWNAPAGSVNVGRILGNDKSNYTGLVASTTDSLFHTVELQHVYSTGRHDLYVNMNVAGFGGVGNTVNTTAVGQNLDGVRTTDLTKNQPLAKLLADIWAAGSNITDDNVKQQRLQTIRGLYQQMSGDTIANSVLLGLNQPWRNSFDRLNLDAQMVYMPGPCVPPQPQYSQQPPQYSQYPQPQYRGQAGGILNMRNIWFTPTAQAVDIRSDDNARGAKIDRAGFQIGFDKRVAQNTSVGFMLGYSNPTMRSGDDRVTATDAQFGVYAGTMVGSYVEMKGFMGFGSQTYKSNRTVFLPNDLIIPDSTWPTGMRPIGGTTRTLTAYGNSGGNTFNFSFEVSRPMFLGFSILRPSIGLDSEHSFRYSFDETGDAIAMRFGRSGVSRTRARFGLSLETCTLDRAIITGRLGYSTLLGGQDYVKQTGQFINVYAPEQTVHSVAVGTSYFDAGVGTRIFLNPYKTLALVGNYDASIADRWVEHQAEVGFSYVF
ncbi:MAG: autotransporter outer membrane beta-barrel domain-containing protein, partial [Thermoguttaceae bacterium]